jgi:hypothetical protein
MKEIQSVHISVCLVKCNWLAHRVLCEPLLRDKEIYLITREAFRGNSSVIFCTETFSLEVCILLYKIKLRNILLLI